MQRFRLRLMAGVLPRCGGSVLLLKRAQTMALAPGKWAASGGHLEPDEIRDPKAAALRELAEEAGIERADVALKYVLVYPTDQELHIHFIYTADLPAQRPVPSCDEGEFRWVREEEIAGLDLSNTWKVLMEDYLKDRSEARVKMGLRRGNAASWVVTDASPDAVFRPAAGILARCGRDILMLHRPLSKALAPGMWANVGGHMEPDEIADPAATALREFEEEAHIAPERLRDFIFSSAVLVAKPHEFGLLIGFSAALDEEASIPHSDEDGDFAWIRDDCVGALPMSPAMKAVALVDAKRQRKPQIGMALGETVWMESWRDCL